MRSRQAPGRASGRRARGHRRPAFRASSESLRVRTTAAATASGSMGTTSAFTPSASSSRAHGRSDTTTGLPQASASQTLRGELSLDASETTTVGSPVDVRHLMGREASDDRHPAAKAETLDLVLDRWRRERLWVLEQQAGVRMVASHQRERFEQDGRVVDLVEPADAHDERLVGEPERLPRGRRLTGQYRSRSSPQRATSTRTPGPPSARVARARSSESARTSCAARSARSDRRRPSPWTPKTSEPHAEQTSGPRRSRAAIQPNSGSQCAWTRSGSRAADTRARERLMRMLRTSGGPSERST